MADKKNQKPLGEGRGMLNEKFRSGQYKGKTTNLTKKQVAGGARVGKAGKATVGKQEARKATKTRIDISETSWKSASERTGPKAKGGIVVGKDGKPITGTVTLASGKTAVYVRGKRVRATTPAKTAKKTPPKAPPKPPPGPPKDKAKYPTGGTVKEKGMPKGDKGNQTKTSYTPSKKINRKRKPQLGGLGLPFRESYFTSRRSPLK
jgi:hypothetical protein